MQKFQTNEERLDKHATRLKPPRGKGPQAKNQPIRRHAKPCRDSSSPRQRAHLANKTKEDRSKPPPPPPAQQGRPLQARQQNSKLREEKKHNRSTGNMERKVILLMEMEY
ncbi:hypothetical protein NC651_032590 [Populus alba x Populus x berolinensis]|nr:hypothetical protein NC651_032590 [Populus alba x Populus x berolinensis]